MKLKGTGQVLKHSSFPDNKRRITRRPSPVIVTGTLEALRKSERKFRTYLENASDLIVIVDINRIVRYTSPSLKRILGYEPEEIVGRMVSFVYPDDAHLLAEPRIQSRLHPGIPMGPLEVRHLHKDGSVRYLELTGTFFIDESGEGYTVMNCRDSTERRLAEDALRVAHFQLETATDLTGVVYWEMDPVKMEFTFDDRFYAILGTTANREGGYRMSAERYLKEFIHPDDLPLAIAMGKSLQEASDVDPFPSVECRVIRRDKEVRYVTTQRKIVRGSDGTIVKIYGVNQDITARKEVEEKLRQSRLQLAEAMELAHVVNWELDVKTGDYLLNDAFYTFLATTAEKEGGYRMPFDVYIKRFFHPDDKWLLEDRRTRILEIDGPDHLEELEHRIVRQDSEIRHVITRTRVIRDNTGNIVRVYGTNQDITERKEMEEILRRNSFQLAAAMELASIAGWEFDAATGEFIFTDAIYKLLGTTAEKEGGYRMSGKEYGRRFFHPDDLPAYLRDMKNVLTSTEPEQATYTEHRFIRRDGEVRYFAVTGKIIRDKQGRITRSFGVNQDTTDRKRAEEALRRSELQLSIAADMARVVYWELDEKTDEFVLNDPFFALLGTTAEKEGGYRMTADKFHRDFIHPADVERLRGKGEELRNYIPLDTIHYRVIRRDGELRHVTMVRKGVANGSNKTVKIYGVLQDVTDRVHMEESLRESESRYRMIAENMSDMIWSLDPWSEQYTYVSPSCLELTGYTPEELMSMKHSSDILVPSSREIAGAHLRIVHGIAASGGRYPLDRFELEGRRKDGSTIWAEVRVNGVYDETGNLTAIQGITMDIAERKKMEEALRTSEGKYRTIFENAMEGIFQLTGDGRFLSANPAMAGILGYETAEELLSSVHDITEQVYVNPENRAALLRTLDTEGAVRNMEAEWRRKDGTSIWVTINEHTVFDKDGEAIYYEGTTVDITERKQTQKLLAQQAEELARSNKELEQFAYIASHDLQEPLRMVASYTELLGKRYTGKLDADADDFIHYAVDGANRMKRLINDLLTYSRVGTQGKPFISVEMKDVVDTAMANLKMAIEDTNARITCDTLPCVLADDVQLLQLFQNLIANAIKFHGEKAPEVHISVARDESDWVVSVKDNGIGIDPKHFERIFQIFQRLHGKREYSGTGIGLAVCKKIVERHGGRLWVESEPGQGSVFMFTIPVMKRVAAPYPP